MQKMACPMVSDPDAPSECQLNLGKIGGVLEISAHIVPCSQPLAISFIMQSAGRLWKELFIVSSSVHEIRQFGPHFWPLQLHMNSEQKHGDVLSLSAYIEVVKTSRLFHILNETTISSISDQSQTCRQNTIDEAQAISFTVIGLILFLFVLVILLFSWLAHKRCAAAHRYSLARKRMAKHPMLPGAMPYKDRLAAIQSGIRPDVSHQSGTAVVLLDQSESYLSETRTVCTSTTSLNVSWSGSPCSVSAAGSSQEETRPGRCLSSTESVL